MSTTEESEICSDAILSEYQSIKNSVSSENTIICQYLGAFSQDILISIVSLIDHSLIQNGEFKPIKKKLSYLVIETIQNIMFHSDQLPDTHQLAYLLIEKNDDGYCIYSSNSILTKSINTLTQTIDSLLDIKKNALSKLFSKKIQTPKINSTGHGGIGLLTMVSKSDKNFNYEIKKASKNYSLFRLEIKLNY